MLRALLWPFSFLYAGVIYARHLCFDLKIFTSQPSDLKAIVIGNIKLGGTGKTPFTIWLLKKLKQEHTAFLSRGYGRSTKGFQIITSHSTPSEVGDEPLEVVAALPHLAAAVCENRVEGINRLKLNEPLLRQVVLDDAFQHRRLIPSFSIVLVDYADLPTFDAMFPLGGLRDVKTRLKKASAIAVTKCPTDLSLHQRQIIRSALRLHTSQVLIFTGITYYSPQPIHPHLPAWDNSMKCVAFAGLANPKKFFEQAQEISRAVITRKFLDHKSYSSAEAEQIRQDWINFGREETRLLTTYKDAVKCINNEAFNDLPIYYLPMEMTCLDGEEQLMSALTNVLNTHGTIGLR